MTMIATYGACASGPVRQLYYPGAANHCPACGSANWLIGRSTAECARCHHALPLSGTPVDGELGQ